jgi:hypothetical protein
MSPLHSHLRNRRILSGWAANLTLGLLPNCPSSAQNPVRDLTFVEVEKQLVPPILAKFLPESLLQS